MAVLHVKSPNGTSYAMTIVTSASPSESIASNGWCTFPNGLMMQWGQTGGVAGWNTWITLPLRMTQYFCCVATGNVEADYGGGDHLTVYRAFHGGIVGRLFELDDPSSTLAFRTVMEAGPSASVIILGY